MYERSVIVLERYMKELLGINKSNNLENNYYTYKEIVEEEKKYRLMLEEESDVIQRFEETAKILQETQREEERLYRNNKALEEEKFSLFYDFETKPETIDKKLNRIEEQNEKNMEEAKEIRKKYVEVLSIFKERQEERNQCARKKKIIDGNHMNLITKTRRLFETIDIKEIKRLKEFIGKDKTEIKNNLLKIMIENGKNEKVGFDENVLSNAINVRIDVADKEAQSYVLIYDKLRRLLNEIENDNVLISKYEKTLRDVTAKLNFLNAEKEYIVGFLDNERMTAMNGVKIHKKMMEEACENFEADIKQIDNLYELIIREAANKSTKKAYKELYNSTYLRDIEEKEKDFEEEITNVRMRGSVINSNYWRIESIKNIYTTFRTEVTEKFERDLSEYEEVPEKIEEKIQNEYIKNLYGDLETSEEEATELKNENEADEFEDEFDNEEYEEDFDAGNKYNNEEYEEDDDDDETEKFDDLDFDEFEDDYEEEDDDDDEKEIDDDTEVIDNETEEIEDDEFDDSDFNIFDKSDYNYEAPSYERNIKMREPKLPQRVAEVGIKKKTLRIKRKDVSNTNNGSITNEINPEKIEKMEKINAEKNKVKANEIIIDSVKTNNDEIKNDIINTEAKNDKIRKKRKKQRIYSNNTSNIEFNNYLNSALDQEKVQPQGITELAPNIEKKKEGGFFNKLRKTSKMLKDSKEVKNT